MPIPLVANYGIPMKQRTFSLITDYLYQVRSTLDVLPVEQITRVIEAIASTRMSGGRVFIFGNGGSAATAAHFASDLSKGAIAEGRPRIKAISLCDNMALIAAWANDAAYECIFAEQLQNLIEEGDIAIGISGSGNSPNVLNGMEVAKSKGAATIGFIGFDGGKLKELVDIPLVVSNYNMEQVEDIHLLLEHIITTCLREC